MKVKSSKFVRISLSPQKNLLLREYYDRRNKVLISRDIGGLGDILMHRMMFEDFAARGVELHFACPRQYHPAVCDHPFLTGLYDCAEVDPRDYLASYNTTTACGRYEMAIAPDADLHRSDIWSKHCGLDLKNHNMHITLTRDEEEYGRNLLAKKTKIYPVVVVCPISSQTTKNICGVQLTGVLDGLRDMGMGVVGIHSKPVQEIEGKKVPMVSGVTIRQWMSVMDAADYVVSVDTSSFHLAGGLGKPTVGIFSWINGKTYAQHYPKVEVVQGPCPVEHAGCYNWTTCPVSSSHRKPCITSLTSEDILDAFARIVSKFPAGNTK